MAYSDNFDAYPVASLVGLGPWTFNPYPGSQFNVSAAQAYSGAHSLKVQNAVTDEAFIYMQPANFVTMSCRVYLTGTGLFNSPIATAEGHPTAAGQATMVIYTNVLYLYTTGYNGGTTLSLNAWHLIEVEVDVTNNRARYRVDGGAWNGYYTGLGSSSPIGQLIISTYSGYGSSDMYIDDVQFSQDPMYDGRHFLDIGV